MSAEENKAVFRRYVEEVGNEGNLDLANEIFDRYRSHQPDCSAPEWGSRTSSGSWGSSAGNRSVSTSLKAPHLRSWDFSENLKRDILGSSTANH